jgi:hypothetical protein
MLCKHCNSELTPLSKEEIKKLKKDAAKAQHLPGWFVLLTFIGCVIWIYYMANPSSSNQAAPTAESLTSAGSSDSNSTAENSGTETSTKTEKAAPKPRWRSFESGDEMSGKKSAYAASPRSSSKRAMDFPYHGTEAWIGFGCDNKNEWVYVGFSEAPNLNDTETQDGYNVVKTRVRWDDTVISETFTQKWGGAFFSFRNDDQAIQRIVSGNNVLVELDWHGQKRSVLFPFTLHGSSNAISEARQACSTY